MLRIRRPPRTPSGSARIMLIPPAFLASTAPHLQLRPFVVGSAFVGTSTSFEARQWLLCLRLGSRLTFERVWVTQELPCIPPGVALDKTLSASGKKCSIGRLTSSIFIEFDADKTPEEPTLICLFREGLKPSIKAQMEQHGWETWISAAHEITGSLTIPWPSSRPRRPEILEMSPPPTPIGSGPVQAPTLLAVQEWQDLRQENSEGEKKTPSSRTDSERLHSNCRCPCPQRSQYGLQGPEPSHLFQQWQEGSLWDKVSQAKERQRHLRRLVTVLVTSALMRLTWTVPREATLEQIPCI